MAERPTGCAPAWGLGQARRGWLSAGDVLTSRRLRQLRRLLCPRLYGATGDQDQVDESRVIGR